MNSMRTLLLFPPQAHFTQPYLALPTLAAYLRQEGFPDTHVMDANIEACHYFLSRSRLSQSLDRIRMSGRLRQLESRAHLGYAEMSAYRSFTQAEVAGDWVVEEIEDAKAALRDPDRFYDYEEYTRAARCIEHGLALVSAEHHPTSFTPHGFSMRHSVQRTDDLLAGAADAEGNPFIEFFREVTMPQIRALNPDLVGISLTFASQAIPALTLAAMLKEWKPEVHVSVGGGLVAYLGEKLAKRPDVFDLLDTLVVLEGERPFSQIAEAIATCATIENIPNIIFRNPDGEVCSNPRIEPLPIDSLPTPDFEGMPLDLYFSPEFIIPLAITRGCYWGKCVFCTLHEVIGPGYRGRSIEKTVEDIAFLKERWGSRHFYFPIEDLPPSMVRRLPEALLEANLDIDWWCDAKLEPEVFTPEVCAQLAEAGCRRLAFGYESASRRVLDLMCKGSDPELGMEVIRRVHDAGISVTLYVMVGFPTETEEEAQLTLNTLVENSRYFEEVSLRVFYLDYKSEVFRRPKDFDIAEVFPEESTDLQIYHDFRTGSGMDRARARRMYMEMLRRLKSHLPVFQNRNVLYHELKSHYFLYLVKAGSVDALMEGAFRERSAPGGLPDRPSAAAGLRVLPIRFDRDEVDTALEAATDGLTLPRYQFDLISGEVLETLDRTVSPIAPSKAVLVLDPRSGEVACLSPEGAELLASCRGDRTTQEVLQGLDPAIRADAGSFLKALAAEGLILEAARERSHA